MNLIAEQSDIIIRCSTLDVQCSMFSLFNVQCSMLDVHLLIETLD